VIVRNPLLLMLVGLRLFMPGAAFAAPDPAAAIAQLAQGSVSRLEWGLDKLERALTETFAIDPRTLAPSSPPFFINVTYARDEGHILVEIGRSFESLGKGQADELCGDYLARVRGFLSVDRTGRPSIKQTSSLTADFFHPPTAAAPPDPGFAKALDRAVMLRGLVASPINGVFAICSASLTHSPIRYVE
jgi:hypothetical protein